MDAITLAQSTTFVSNAVGFLSTALFLYSDIQEDDERLDKFYTLGNCFFLTHLALLSSFIPAITVLLAVIRNLLNKHFPTSNLIKYFFVTAFTGILLISLVAMGEWQLSLPALVSLIMTFAFLYASGNLLTWALAVCSLLWIVVGIHINSYPTIAIECLSLILLAYRYVKQSNKEASPN